MMGGILMPERYIKPMTVQTCKVYKPIGRYDAVLERITRESPGIREPVDYDVEVGIYESMGEKASDVIVLSYEGDAPTTNDIEKDLRGRLEEEYGNLSDSGILSGREEMQLNALNKLKRRGII